MKKIFGLFFLILIVSSPVLADTYDLREITPKVQAALDGRRSRFSELENLKDQGKVGESREGLVVNLAGDPAASRIVEAENRDRELIYQEIVEQNELPKNELPTVHRVFGETQRNKAKSGQQIQLENGEWVNK